MKRLLAALLACILFSGMAAPAAAQEPARHTARGLLLSNQVGVMVVQFQGDPLDGPLWLAVDTDTTFYDRYGEAIDRGVLIPGQRVRARFRYRPQENVYVYPQAALESLTLLDDVEQAAERIAPESLPTETAVGTIAKIRREPPDNPGEPSYTVADIYTEAGQVDRSERNDMVGTIHQWKMDGLRVDLYDDIYDEDGRRISFRDLKPGQRVRFVGDHFGVQFNSIPLSFDLRPHSLYLLGRSSVLDPAALATYSTLHGTITAYLDEDFLEDNGPIIDGYFVDDPVQLYLLRAEPDSWAGRQQTLYEVDYYGLRRFQIGDEVYVHYSMIRTEAPRGAVHTLRMELAEEAGVSLADWIT